MGKECRVGNDEIEIIPPLSAGLPSIDDVLENDRHIPLSDRNTFTDMEGVRTPNDAHSPISENHFAVPLPADRDERRENDPRAMNIMPNPPTPERAPPMPMPMPMPNLYHPTSNPSDPNANLNPNAYPNTPHDTKSNPYSYMHDIPSMPTPLNENENDPPVYTSVALDTETNMDMGLGMGMNPNMDDLPEIPNRESMVSLLMPPSRLRTGSLSRSQMHTPLAQNQSQGQGPYQPYTRPPTRTQTQAELEQEQGRYGYGYGNEPIPTTTMTTGTTADESSVPTSAYPVYSPSGHSPSGYGYGYGHGGGYGEQEEYAGDHKARYEPESRFNDDVHDVKSVQSHGDTHLHPHSHTRTLTVRNPDPDPDPPS